VVQKKIEEATSVKKGSFEVLRIDEPPQLSTESRETNSQQLKLSVLPVD
jgi:hypothetical protein